MTGDTYRVYTAAKDSFGILPQDQLVQYPAGSSVAITNYARLYRKTAERKEQVLTTAAAATRISREALLTKSVYDADGKKLGSAPTAADGAVLNYQPDFTHCGAGEYDDLAMVDDLCGSQYLMVLKDENPGLADKGLTEKEYQGDTYYILTEGSYRNIVVGMNDEDNLLTAATVTVEKADTETQTVGGSYTGIHTQIKWYFAHLDGGSYRKTVSYQAVVDLSTTGVSYTIGNIGWMNDRTGSRLYASLWGGGAMIRSDKEILETQGAEPSADVVNEDDYSTISKGGQMTYRLTLRDDSNSGSFENRLRAKDFADALPETYGVFQWTKGENITVEWENVGDVELSGLENWGIVPETGIGLVAGRQCLAWADGTEITFCGSGRLHLYVTLTFPKDTEGGGEIDAPLPQLRGGYRKSCGCLSHPPLKDFVGKRFGRLTVLAYAGKRAGMHRWKCRCDCGIITVVGQTLLRSGKTKSCGCLQAAGIAENLKLCEGTSVAILEATMHRLRPTNTSGYTGVHQNRRTGKWCAQITCKGKAYSLGTYFRIEDAVKARKKAEDRLFGEFLDWYYSTHERPEEKMKRARDAPTMKDKASQ